MKRFLEKRGLWLLLAIAVVAVTLAAMSIFSSTASPLGNIVGVITSPFRSAAQSVADWYNEKQDYFADNRALRAAPSSSGRCPSCCPTPCGRRMRS